jgi:predicted small secreted protein
MKKLIGLALVLALATTLGACQSGEGGGGESPAGGGAPAESPTTSPS